METRILTISLALAFLTPAARGETTLEYTNPLWDGYLADPFAFKVGDTWYAVGTGEAPDGRRMPILKSENFTDWEFVAGALEPMEDIDEYWAPEIAEKDGKFYLYWAGNRKMRVAVADKPAGPYKDTGKLMFPDLEFSIDGHAFHDPKSKDRWFFFAKDFFDQRPGTALAAVKLKDDMMTPDGEPVTVLRAFADWQIYERDRDLYDRKWPAWHTVEGPAVIFRDGSYQLFYSGGNWQTPGYGVGRAVSETITGPYVDKQSKERAAVIHSIEGKLIGPGHNSVILGPDGETWFNIYHSWNADRTKRQMCMDPLVWTADGPVTHDPSRGKKKVALPLK
ncbi:MAG: family 43 glycosylhydrolase [Akkermansiaceae bacterium]|nr:family 43 glycosylhydrolase [Akkermansiaceae bacterium]MCP5544382.1 family 43 glycosylhydrolase [Akkermansiaceae bacterium]MCP5547452.1 family 43 glycosylhydrolase [Akkermansiaceae bacterium]